MEKDTLLEQLEKPEIHQYLLPGYRGPYSLGLTQVDKEGKYAFRLQVADADVARKVPRTIKIGDEEISIIVTDGFQAPVPLKTGGLFPSP